MQGLVGLWHLGAGQGRTLGEATCAGLQGQWRFSPRESGELCLRERPSKAQVSRCEKQTAKEQPVRGCVGAKAGAEAGREAGLGHLRPLFSGGDLRGSKDKPSVKERSKRSPSLHCVLPTMSRGLLSKDTCLVCRHRKKPPTSVSGDRAFLYSPCWLGNCSLPASASWCWDYRYVSPRNHFSLLSGPILWVLAVTNMVCLPLSTPSLCFDLSCQWYGWRKILPFSVPGAAGGPERAVSDLSWVRSFIHQLNQTLSALTGIQM